MWVLCILADTKKSDHQGRIVHLSPLDIIARSRNIVGKCATIHQTIGRKNMAALELSGNVYRNVSRVWHNFELTGQNFASDIHISKSTKIWAMT